MPQTKKGIEKIKAKYGEDHFRRIGKMGGNPLLIQQGIANREKKAKEK